MVLSILLGIVVLIILTFFVYFLAYGLIGLFTKPVIYQQDETNRHYTVLIPARNEEKVIGSLIQSLKKQDYPERLIDIYVVLNNSTDSTDEVALKNGANIIPCMGKIQSKGEALKEAFEVIHRANSDTDAYLVFDADNVVAPSFVSEMNKAFNKGYQIVQGRRMGKNSSMNAVTGIYELFYMMQNVFFNNARSRGNKNASINGTGWGITSEWIRQYGFPVLTLTEDIELTIWAAMHGTVIGYVNDAVTYDEYPSSLNRICKQLPRWIFGQIQCMREYSVMLIKKGRKNIPCVDMLLILLMPLAGLALTILMIITIFMSNTCTLTIWLHKYLLPVCLVLYISILALEILEIKKSDLKRKLHISSLFLFPIFLLVWIPIADISIFRNSCIWEKVEHDYVVDIEEMK